MTHDELSGHVQRLRLEPGDILVLTMPKALPDTAVNAICARLEGSPFNLKERGVAVMVLDQGAGPTVLGSRDSAGLCAGVYAQGGVIAPNEPRPLFGEAPSILDAMVIGSRRLVERMGVALAGLPRA